MLEITIKKMGCNKFKLCRLLLLIFLCFYKPVFAQDSPEIQLSKQTVSIDGKRFYVHIIEKGQTLYAIAKAYDVDIEAIIDENPSVSSGIQPGQSLRIPVTDKKVRKALKEKEKKEEKERKKRDEQSAKNKEDNKSKITYGTHKVDAGQTIYSIAKQYNITPEQLSALNPEVKDSGLKIGQQLKIPVAATLPATGGNPKSGTAEEESKELIKRLSTDKTAPINVALLLPFQLGGVTLIDPDRVRRGNIVFPEKAKIAVEFYSGALFALDSLKKLGVSVKLHIYDTGSDSSEVISNELKLAIKSMDLVIGPLYASKFSAVAKLAAQYNIPIVSPLTQNNKILLGNPVVSKVMPSSITQAQAIGLYIAEKYSRQNVLMINLSNPKEQQYGNILKQAFNEEAKRYFAKSDTIKIVKSINDALSNLSSTKTNILIVPTANPSFVTDFLSKLYPRIKENKNQIVVFGMQSWQNIESLDYVYMNGLKLHLSAPTYLNYDNVEVIKFVKKYRAIYNTEPGEYVFTGFDVTFFYINSLYNYGTKQVLKKLPQIKGNGYQAIFDFYQTSPSSGFENKGVHILKYEDSSLIKVN